MNAAFQAAYAIGLLLFGALIDRVGSRIGYAISIAAWSLAAVAHAAASSVGGFMTARVALGLGEGGNFPRPSNRSRYGSPRANALSPLRIFNSGSNVGAIIAPAMIPCWPSRGAGSRRSLLRASRASSGCCCGCRFTTSRKGEEASSARAGAHSERPAGKDTAGKVPMGWMLLRYRQRGLSSSPSS